MEENKEVKKDQNLEGVAGGEFGNVTCPNCGSSNVSFYYEHDEIGVFKCNNCHKQFSKRYGE